MVCVLGLKGMWPEVVQEGCCHPTFAANLGQLYGAVFNERFKYYHLFIKYYIYKRFLRPLWIHVCVQFSGLLTIRPVFNGCECGLLARWLVHCFLYKLMVVFLLHCIALSYKFDI